MTYEPGPLDRFKLLPPVDGDTPYWRVYDMFGLFSSKSFNANEEQQARDYCRRMNAVYPRLDAA